MNISENKTIKSYDVAIIGGGLAGLLVAYNLLTTIGSETKFLRGTIIEPAERLGQGLAYRDVSSAHILNVPTAKMSISEREPDSFLKWLIGKGYKYSNDSFAPRHLYGEYVYDVFHSTNKSKIFFHKKAHAIEIAKLTTGTYQITDSNGDITLAKHLVLALGNSPLNDSHPPKNNLCFLAPTDRIAIAKGCASKHVGIIGTGLSAIDTVLALEELGFSGTYTLVSRRGLLPKAHFHSDTQYPHLEKFVRDIADSQSLLLAFRNFRRIMQASIPWPVLLDGLRPWTQSFWKNLSSSDKRRFLRHLKPYWEVFRHRVPNPSLSVIEGLMNEGRLRIVRGRLQENHHTNGQVCISVTTQKSGVQNLNLDLVFDCRGLWTDITKTGSCLINQMIKKGLAQCDELKLGLLTTADGVLLNDQSSAQIGLYTLGSLRRGEIWETTAARELRTQAAIIANLILKELTIQSDTPNTSAVTNAT